MGSGVFAQAIDRHILQFIHRSFPEDPSDEAFNLLAMEIFAYQFAHNTTYRMFCMQRRSTPDQIYSWEQIPPAPVSAFKAGVFSCFPAHMSIRVFETSGTTTGNRGRHQFDTMTLYEEAALPNFSQHLLPDGACLPMRMLLPPPAEAPQSSLAYMCQIVSESFANETEWYIRSGRLNVEALCKDLEIAEESGTPRILLGPAFSFVHLFDALRSKNRTFCLPRGSRIMETGGYKGKSREVTREEFLRSAEEMIGVGPLWIINEYGMTELTSQMYDDTLRRAVHTGSAALPVKIPPTWVKVRVHDPVTQEPSPDGIPGLIRIWDLANRGSAVAIQTEDVGVMEGRGFRVIGRAKGSEDRGCSRAVDEALSE